MSIHSQLIGDNVHQPKGADTALNGQAIKALGNGLTEWVNLFLGRLIANISTTSTSYTGTTITDNTAVATDETSVEELNEDVLDKDALINKNFHAVASIMNENTTAIETAITTLDTDIVDLTSKLNDIITLLQDVSIARGA